MLHGTAHEVDSLKSLIRHHEQRLNDDTTFIYYYPSNLPSQCHRQLPQLPVAYF